MRGSEIIKGGAFGYRTENPWVDRSTFRTTADGEPIAGWQGELRTLESYLDNPRMAGLKYRFYNTPGNAHFQKRYREIPFTLIVDYAHTLMRPVYTDFTEASENREFAKISGKFYYELFIQEYIFVTYNVFEVVENGFIKDDGGVKEENRRTMEAIKRKGGFDLWVKLDEDEYSENNEFMHIDTSLIVVFPKWREELAWCKGSTAPQNNLSNGLNIAGTEIAMTDYLSQCIRIAGKKIILTSQGQNEAQEDQLKESMNSFDNFYHFNLKNTADIEPFVAFSGEDLREIRDGTYMYLDRMKYEYGRVANTNPKGDRMTSGENYKDISAIGNRQKETLEYMINFAFQVEELWGISLTFVVNGIPEKEAIATVSHMAQNPNMEKLMFGQVEGTQPRVPMGETGVRKTNKPPKGSH